MPVVGCRSNSSVIGWYKALDGTVQMVLITVMSSWSDYFYAKMLISPNP